MRQHIFYHIGVAQFLKEPQNNSLLEKSYTHEIHPLPSSHLEPLKPHPAVAQGRTPVTEANSHYYGKYLLDGE